jgi:hypothetical protein
MTSESTLQQAISTIENVIEQPGVGQAFQANTTEGVAVCKVMCVS